MLMERRARPSKHDGKQAETVLGKMSQRGSIFESFATAGGCRCSVWIIQFEKIGNWRKNENFYLKSEF